jgi:peptidoglycan/xylan/chitin deacetylase (PgdA/CDA1 family)
MILIVCFFAISGSPAFADERQGGLVLMFDDGYPCWTKIIAPELSQVDGVATGYVNNYRIHSETISFHDLRTLQNTYGWEIGTHTFNHENAEIFVKLHGISSWVRNELEASVVELRSQGLKINSIVFPFNQCNKELITEINKRLACYRRYDDNPIARGKKENGSIPGRSIDIGQYVPLNQIFKWIDIAHRYNKLLFLYGHKVLPDNMFTCGTVASLTKRTLVAQEKITLRSDETLCLVPDTSRQVLNAGLVVTSIDGTSITIGNGDLNRLTRNGATFIIGPCKAVRLSDFRSIIEYAAKKLYFRTVHNALNTHPAALPNP